MLEVFDIQFKEAIKYGMTYEQFWFDCPSLYYVYQDAYKEKLKEKDIFNWQLGAYIQMAVATMLDAKGKAKYPEEPIFYAKERKVAPNKTIEARDKFLAQVAMVNNKFK